MSEQRDALVGLLSKAWDDAYRPDTLGGVCEVQADAILASDWLDEHERGTTAMTLDMAAEQIAVKWGRFNTTANRIADDLHQHASSIREGVE